MASVKTWKTLASISKIKRISERQSLLNKTALDSRRRFLSKIEAHSHSVFHPHSTTPVFPALFLGKLPIEGNFFGAKIFGGEQRVMKTLKRIFWIAPLALLIV